MSRDLRRFADTTTRRLIAGVILILFVVGGGLIYAIYGPEAAVLGVSCLFVGLAPLLLIAIIFKGLDWFIKRERDNDQQ